MDPKAAAAALYENVTAPVFCCDGQWILTYCNPAAKRQFLHLREGFLIQPQLPELDWKKAAEVKNPGAVVRLGSFSFPIRYTAAASRIGGGYLIQLIPSDALPELQSDHATVAGMIESRYRLALSGIFHNNDMLRSRLEEAERYEDLAFLERIDAGAYRALRFTLALSEYMRLSVPDTALSGRPVELTAFLEDLCRKIHQLLCRCREIRFSYSLPQEKAVTLLDGERFSMMLLELIDNACRYRMGDTEINLSLALEEDSYTVTVSDTGQGMETDRIPDAMLPFAAEAEDGQRTGLGLFLAGRIASLHKGNLMISSAPCEGTRVSLRFPIIRPEEGNYTLLSSGADPGRDRFSLPYLDLWEHRLDS